MKWMIVAALFLPSLGYAAGHQDAILECVNSMNEDTTWDQCRTQIFEPCKGNEVGTDAHLACLTAEGDAWLAKMDAVRIELFEKLTMEGATTVGELSTQWIGYVNEKCTLVGEARAHISREAAEQGCEISEIVGISAEFQSCINGTSKLAFCTLKE